MPEERPIIRRNNLEEIRFEVECERKGPDVRVMVAPQVDGAASLPVRKERYQGPGQVSEHPTMRVFDEFLTNPNSKVDHLGRITHVCVRGATVPPVRHLISVVETRTNIMLFPAWGTGPMCPLKPEAQPFKGTVVGHVTWNKRGKQRRIHLSGGARGGRPKAAVGKSVPLKDGGTTGLHAARLSVYSLDNLDPLALVHMMVPATAWGVRDIAQTQAGINNALTPHSAVSVLPAEWASMADSHLEACFAMKQGAFGNDDFVRPDKEPPVASKVEQILKVPLMDPWNMIVQLRLIPGKAPRAFGWAPG